MVQGERLRGMGDVSDHRERLRAGVVSMSDSDVPTIAGYRQVTDAHLLTLARRRSVRLVTFDSSVLAMGDGNDVEVLTLL